MPKKLNGSSETPFWVQFHCDYPNVSIGITVLEAIYIIRSWGTYALLNGVTGVTFTLTDALFSTEAAVPLESIPVSQGV